MLHGFAIEKGVGTLINELWDLQKSVLRVNKILLQVDVNKAFNAFSRNFIYKTFFDLKLPNKLLCSIQFFMESEAYFLEVDPLKGHFYSNLGVPPGSPLSLTLFLICMIGIHNKLKTLSSVKVLFYADDIFFFIYHKKREFLCNLVDSVLCELAVCLRNANLSTNRRKTTLVPLTNSNSARKLMFVKFLEDSRTQLMKVTKCSSARDQFSSEVASIVKRIHWLGFMICNPLAILKRLLAFDDLRGCSMRDKWVYCDILERLNHGKRGDNQILGYTIKIYV
ncbi:hypothetical protein ACOME3_010486 [Neoechinorhynchus agilis]